MRLRRWLICFMGIFTLTLLSVSFVSAQTKQYVEQVDVSGQTQLLRYPDTLADQADSVKTALATIIPIYEKYWHAPSGGGSLPMDFRVFIDMGTANPNTSTDASAVSNPSIALPVPSAPAPWTGKVEARKTSVCAVQLYANAPIYSAATRFQFELALDLAQCYLLHYAAPPAQPPDWWYKGLSYWMAVQVYPPPSDILPRLQKLYEDNYNQSLLNAGEEAVYFWEYLLGDQMPATLRGNFPASLPDLVNGLKNLSNATLMFTPELFYSYAQVVADEKLLWQPSADDLAQNKQVAFFPDEVDLELEENSIVIEKVSLPSLTADEGVDIQAEGLANNKVLASIVGADGSVSSLADGAKVEVCGALTSVSIIAGRGGQSALPDPKLTFSKVESCKKPQPTAEATADSGFPVCLIGTWNVRFPFMEQYVSFTAGTWQYTFNADGSLLVQAQDLTTKSKAGLTIVMNYDVAGNVILQADPKTANRFNILQWSSKLQPGASVVGTDSNGFSIDESQVLQGANNQLTAPPAYLTCDSADAKNPTVNLYVSGAGATYNYILSRAS